MSFKTAAGANYWEMQRANPFVQPAKPFTLMAWVKLTSTATNFSVICSTYDGTTGSWEFGAVGAGAQTAPTTNNGWYFTWNVAGTYYGYGQGTANGAASSSVLSVGQWYHLVIRYGIGGITGATTNYDMVQDGIVVGTSNASAVAPIAAGVRKLRIHQSSDNAGAGMPGSTAHIRMFNGCLKLADIVRCRNAIVVPQNLEPWLIYDIPGIGRTDQGIPFDTGPINLGGFIKVGTVGNDWDPPTSTRPHRQLLRKRDHTAGGTPNTQSLAGSVTPTGTLTKAVFKTISGSVTATGALTKQTAKSLAGSSTPTGAMTKTKGISLAGASTPTGSLVKKTSKALAGSSTPTGALTKAISKTLTGSLTATGALTKACAKALAGSVTATGLLVKAISKALAGSVTATGTLTTIKIRLVLLSLSGSVTPTGALTKQTQKNLAGSSTPTGSLKRAVSKFLAGSVTTAGVLTKAISKAFAGLSIASGVLTKKTSKSFAGSVTATGAFIKQVGKVFSGSSTGTGSLSFVKAYKKLLTGSVTPTGVITQTVSKVFSGSVTFVGTLRKLITKVFTGSVTPTGTLTVVQGGSTFDPANYTAVWTWSSLFERALNSKKAVLAIHQFDEIGEESDLQYKYQALNSVDTSTWDVRGYLSPRATTLVPIKTLTEGHGLFKTSSATGEWQIMCSMKGKDGISPGEYVLQIIRNDIGEELSRVYITVTPTAIGATHA